ncbi:MAG: acyl-CoA carboxylase subunit epsilon [Propionibacteriaceae bacterium]|jgi:hypothetical protein|nr:acyl-CoA carboxylase subunit epsilon [Propionibacteriaceae bacterium]
MSATQPETPQPPLVHVTAGDPTDEELAALAAVMVALRRDRPKPHAPSTSTLAGGWRSFWHTIRSPILPGRDAWRSSFRG